MHKERAVDPSARAGPSRNRPLSRASTTSMHSTATYQGLDPSAFGEMPWHAARGVQNAHQHQVQQNHNHHPQQQSPLTPHMQPLQQQQQQQLVRMPYQHQHHIPQVPPPQHQSSQQQQYAMPSNEAMMHPGQLHQQQQQQNGGMHSFGMDPGMAGVAINHVGPRTNLPDISFTDNGSSIMEHDENGEGDSRVAAAPTTTTKPTRSSANNEREMRNLFLQNRHRTLPEVAGELQGNDRGAHSERARQLFAMLWINQVCFRGNVSTPRGRVYTAYASRCSTERVTVLNPASFGKLVRVLFPGLKTRRLGVRGESKYHYVDFDMVGTGLDKEPSLAPPGPRPILPDTANPLHQM
jgi:regulatory factor X